MENNLVLFISATRVSVLGQDFHRGIVVCLKAPCDDDFPEFGEVTHILVPEESKLLLVQKFLTGSYSEHYNAYCVTKTSYFTLINVGDLALHDVFHPYSVLSSHYIVVRSSTHVEMLV